MRCFNDFSLFNTEAISLTISSLSLNDVSDSLFDFDNIVSDNLVKNEFIEYIIIHYEYLNEEIERCANLKNLSTIKLKMVSFEKKINYSLKKFGEVESYISHSLRSDNVVKVKNRINDSFDAREKYLMLINNNKDTKNNVIMTITFGLIASTSLTKDFVIPFLNQFYPTILPATEDTRTLVIFPITTLIILLVIHMFRR